MIDNHTSKEEDITTKSSLNENVHYQRDLEILYKISQDILSQLDFSEVSQNIVDHIANSTLVGEKSDFVNVVLYLYNENMHAFKFSTMSNNEISKDLSSYYEHSFHDQIIPLHHPSSNGLQRLYYQKKYQATSTSEEMMGTENLNTHDTQEYLERWKIKSYIASPLLHRGHVIGALQVATPYDVENIPERMRKNLELFVGQATIALINAQLYEKSKQQLKVLSEKNIILEKTTSDLRRLQNTLQFISSTNDFSKTAQNIVDTIAEVSFVDQKTETNVAVLYLLEKNGNNLFFRFFKMSRNQKTNLLRQAHKDPFEERKILLDKNLTKTIAIQRVFFEGTIQYASSLEEALSKTTLNVSNITAKYHKEWGIRSHILLPLKIKNQIIGALHVSSSFPKNEIPAELIKNLESFAAQSAIALENSRLYHKVEQQVHELQEKNRILEKRTLDIRRLQRILHEISSTQDIGTTAQKIVDVIVEKPIVGLKPEFAIATLYLIKKDAISPYFSLYKISNNDKMREARVAYQHPFENRIVRIEPKKQSTVGLVRMYYENKIQYVRTIDEAVGYDAINVGETTKNLFKIWGVQSLLLIPLKMKDEIIGALQVSCMSSIDNISDDLVKNLESFAAQAAIAIENARLYDRTSRQLNILRKNNNTIRKKTKDLRRLQTLIQEISSTKDFKNVAQNIVDTIASVAIVEEESEILLAIIYSLQYSVDGTPQLVFNTISNNNYAKELQNNFSIPFVKQKIQLSHTKINSSAINRMFFKKSVQFSSSFIETMGENIINVTEKAEELFRSWGANSHICFPLLRKGNVIGALYVASFFEVEKIPDDLIINIRSFANQSAIALENAQLLEQAKEQFFQIQQQNQDLKILSKVNEYIVETINFNKRIQHIVDAVPKEFRQVHGFLAAILTLREGKTTMFRTVASSNVRLMARIRKLLKRNFQEYSFDLSSYQENETGVMNATVQAIRKKKVITTESFVNMFYPIFTNDECTACEKILPSQTSIIACPIVLEKEVVGILHFFVGVDKKTIGDRRFALVKAYTDNCSLAIHNSRIYDDLEHAYQELKQIDQAKMEFVAMASHQLRTPMTAIKGYISMLEDGSYGPITAEQQRSLKFILNNMERLSSTVEDILSVSHLETGNLVLNKTNVDIETIVHDVIQLASNSFKKEKIILTHICPTEKIPPVFVDRQKITQVISNLVENAFHYTETGEITITTKIYNRNILVVIADTGIGIAPEHIGTLFDKFTRADNAKKIRPDGSGIGLYLAKSVMLAHGGDITVRSTLGKGTEFTISLPILHKQDL